MPLKERMHRVGQRLVEKRKAVSAATLLILFAFLWLSYDPVSDVDPSSQQTLALPSATNASSSSNIKETSKISGENNNTPVYKLSEANQKAIELALTGQANQATRILEQALLNDPQAGVVFENLRRLYAGFASQSYQLALEPNKPKEVTVELASAERTISVLLDTPKTNNNTTPQTIASASTLPTTPHVNPPQPVAETKKEATPAVPVAKPLVSATRPMTPPSVNEPAAAQKEAAQHKASQQATNQAIHQALKRWSDAWSRQDVKAYFASYAPAYSPKGSTRKAWMDNRQERILAPKRIKVELNDINIVLLKPNLAKVTFVQTYTSDTLSTRNQKTLELELINNSWLITFESGR